MADGKFVGRGKGVWVLTRSLVAREEGVLGDRMRSSNMIKRGNGIYE